MKIQLYICPDQTGGEAQFLHIFMVEDKFCFYNSDIYNLKAYVKLNIKIFKRLKYTKERMIKDGCWMKNEADLIKELF